MPLNYCQFATVLNSLHFSGFMESFHFSLETLNFEVGLYCVLTISNFDAIDVVFLELNWQTAASIQTLYIAKYQSRIRYDTATEVDSLSET